MPHKTPTHHALQRPHVTTPSPRRKKKSEQQEQRYWNDKKIVSSAGTHRQPRLEPRTLLLPPLPPPILLEGIDRDGEADTRGAPRRGINGRVHADDAPNAVQQRTPAVSRVDGSVGLDDVRDRTPARRLDLPPQPRDHPHGQSVVQAERVSYGQGQLAHLVCGKPQPRAGEGVEGGWPSRSRLSPI